MKSRPVQVHFEKDLDQILFFGKDLDQDHRSKDFDLDHDLGSRSRSLNRSVEKLSYFSVLDMMERKMKFVPDMENATNVTRRISLPNVLVMVTGTVMIVLVPRTRMYARTNAPNKYVWDMEHANVPMVNDANVMKDTMENIANVNR